MIQNNKIYRLFALIVIMVGTWTAASAAEVYKLTLAEGAEAHGTVSFKVGETALTGETLTAEEGQTVTIAVACTGWTVSQITATASLDPTQMKSRTRNGEIPVIEEIPLTQGDGNIWTMTMPAADVEIGVSYEEIQTKAVEASWITITDGTYTYNGQAIEPTLTVTDGETDVTEKFTVSYSNNVNASDAATVTVTAKASYPAYTGSASKTFSIAPKAVTITAQSHAFTYTGAAQSWPQYDVDGLVGEDAITAVITGSITYPSESPVTNKVESYEFTSGTAGNYSVTTQNGELTMTNASIAITITAASGEWTYDGTAHTNNTVTITSGELLEGDALVAEATSSATNVADTQDGNNPIAEGYKVMHGTEDVTANYVITPVAGKLTINPKEVSVKANDITISYGDAEPALTYTADALCGNDRFSGTLERVAGTAVGEYAINQGSLSAGSNYEISFTPGKFTIKAIAISGVKVEGWSGVFDGLSHTISVTIPAGATIKFKDSKGVYTLTEVPSFNTVGTHTVEYKVSKTGCEDVTGSATVEIKSAIVIGENGQVTIGGKVYTSLSDVAKEVLGDMVPESLLIGLAEGITTLDIDNLVNRIVVSETYKLTVTKGKDAIIGLLKAKAGQIVRLVYTGQITLDTQSILKYLGEIKARAIVRTRTEGDGEMTIESGVEYLVLEDCDIFFTLHTEEAPVEIESITIYTPVVMPGDADGNGIVDTKDIVAMINAIAGNPADGFRKDNADVNGDGILNIADIVFVINLIDSTRTE